MSLLHFSVFANVTGGSSLTLSGLQHVLLSTTLPDLDKESLLVNNNTQHLLHNTYTLSYFLYNFTLLQVSANPSKTSHCIKKFSDYLDYYSSVLVKLPIVGANTSTH